MEVWGSRVLTETWQGRRCGAGGSAGKFGGGEGGGSRGAAVGVRLPASWSRVQVCCRSAEVNMGSEGLEHHRRCWIEAAQGLTSVEVAAALRSEQRQGGG